MKRATKKPRPRTTGFTIIEVLIVLAIAGLVIMIIFLAVPAMKRSSRDFGRKHAMDMTAAALDEYAVTHGRSLPDTPTQMCDFVTNYLKDEIHPQGSCSATYVGGKGCVLVTGVRYDVCYHDRDSSPHSYKGPLDEISIQLAHWCNQPPHYYSGDGSNRITSGGSPIDNEIKRYVVWTELEGSHDGYCLDNYAG